MRSSADGGSFRDPSGQVFEVDNRVFRTITQHASADYEFVRSTGFLERAAEQGWVVEAREVDPAESGAAGEAVRYVLEHPRLNFISYPYEWPFPALKAAALLHLDLQLTALEQGIVFSDASAYNVQFDGARPLFIDVLSLRRYREGEFWTGHGQFCEQFLNPLLLRALRGVPHNAWYRGSLEGITTAELASLLPLRRKFSWNVLSHVVLPARLQASAGKRDTEDLRKIKQKKLPRQSYQGMLTQLRNWIARLQPSDTGATVWGDYVNTHTYETDEEAAKRRFVAEFAAHTKPTLLWDLGCNTGEYSEVALGAGAQHGIGFDFDQQALETGFSRSQSKGLDFLPLFMDAANPSPGQGWNCAERKGLRQRGTADAILALAFEHHLAIGRNVPLDMVVDWLTGLAPQGVIEFIRKDDPTIQRMLALRKDVFPDYTESQFSDALQRNARIIRSEKISSTQRQLFWYSKE